MLPKGWRECKFADIARIDVARDLNESSFSPSATPQHKYPVYSNTVQNRGLYGYYDYQEFDAGTLTVVGRGIGLGTAFSRAEAFGAIGRLLILSPKKGSFDPDFLADYINFCIRIHFENGAIPQLPGSTFGNYKVLIPPPIEQKKIAEILSIWDRAIAVQEQLVANARAQKQALMQTLLTGKKRLPGFKGECKWIAVSEILTIETGGSNREDSLDVGPYTFFDRSTDVRRSDQYLFDTEAIVIGGEGQDFIPKYYVGKFDLHQRAYALFDFRDCIGKFVYFAIYFYRHLLLRYSVGSTVASLRMPTFKKVTIWLPNIQEQGKIADLLTAQDRNIECLEANLLEFRQEKSALMQQLLTGKRRLKVEAEA
jgi:restriction endonuclease S subunit